MKIKNLTAGTTVGELEQAKKQVAKLKAQNKKLRALIEQVEWVLDANQDMYCPWCRHWQDEEDDDGRTGHASDCARQLTLGKITTNLPLRKLSRSGKRPGKSSSGNP